MFEGLRTEPQLPRRYSQETEAEITAKTGQVLKAMIHGGEKADLSKSEDAGVVRACEPTILNTQVPSQDRAPHWAANSEDLK